MDEQTDAKTKQTFSNGIYYGLYGMTIEITCPPTLRNLLPEKHIMYQHAGGHLRLMPLF